MRGLQLPRCRSARRRSRPYGYVPSLLAALALLVVPAVASAATGFTEQVASARWLIPFECPDGSMAPDGRLIVETDNFIEAGTTPDPNPPLRVGFVGLCPDGTFSWGLAQAAPTQFDPNLKNVSVSGTFTGVRDNRGGLHTVSVDARWSRRVRSRPRATAALDARGALGDATAPNASTATRSSTAPPTSCSPRRSSASTRRSSSSSPRNGGTGAAPR